MPKSWVFISIFMPKLIIGFVLATMVHTNANADAFLNCGDVQVCGVNGIECITGLGACKQYSRYVTCNGTIYYDCTTCKDDSYSVVTNYLYDGPNSYYDFHTCDDNCPEECDSRSWTPVTQAWLGTSWESQIDSYQYENAAARCLVSGTTNNYSYTCDLGCVPGYYEYSDSDDGYCVECPANATCAGGNEKFKCVAGYYKRGHSCDACPNGATTSESGATSVSSCECLEGYYGNASGGSACTACPLNAICDGGNGSTFSCNANYYQSGTTCVACQPGYTSPAGSTSSNDCTPSTPMCDAGYFLDGNECKECPPSYCYFKTDNRSTYMDPMVLACLNQVYGQGQFEYPECLKFKPEADEKCGLNNKKNYIQQGASSKGAMSVNDCFLPAEELNKLNENNDNISFKVKDDCSFVSN